MNAAQVRNKQAGFTLVELLIVIVVIAILAAITFVAYNGIQNRAHLAAVQSDMYNAKLKLETFKVENNGVYPNSVNDCPLPASTNLCLSASSGDTYIYAPLAKGTPFGIQSPSYELTIENDNQFLYSSPAVITRNYEFMQYTDLASIINKYGLVKYQLSFDIESADVSSKSTIQAYFQNGSGTKYAGLSQGIPVTTSFTHHVVTFTAVLANSSLTQAMLAFYGTYGTGNDPTVANVQFQKAP